jgi:peptidoglycan hydrolase-like protein with peptidoglycan-binding domain
MALLPALTSAASASAAVSCTGTSLVPDEALTGSVRVPTTANNTLIFDCELGPGNQGVAVQRLQIALDHCVFFDHLAVDGIYGPATQAAVRAAQTFLDVPVDGIYGPQTAIKMAWPVAGSNYSRCEDIRSGT